MEPYCLAIGHDYLAVVIVVVVVVVLVAVKARLDSPPRYGSEPPDVPICKRYQSFTLPRAQDLVSKQASKQMCAMECAIEASSADRQTDRRTDGQTQKLRVACTRLKRP